MTIGISRSTFDNIAGPTKEIVIEVDIYRYNSMKLQYI